MNASVEATSTFRVTGMTCSHCERAISEEVRALAGVTAVAVDVAAGTITVSTTAPLEPAVLAAAVDEAGYTLLA